MPLTMFTDTSVQPKVSEHEFNVFCPAPGPKLHNQQADYLRIRQDKFGKPSPDGPDLGHQYSYRQNDVVAIPAADGS